jgi:hypothetical protein
MASCGCTTMAIESTQSQSFSVETHGDIAVITPSIEDERLAENVIQLAAQMVFRYRFPLTTAFR